MNDPHAGLPPQGDPPPHESYWQKQPQAGPEPPAAQPYPQPSRDAYPPPGYGYPPPGYGYPPPGYGYPQQGYGYPQQGYATAGAPPAHLGWAITALIFFWPLAIAAFINYGRVESSFVRGDVYGAQRASANVRKYGIIALVVGLAIAVLWLVFAVALVGSGDCTSTFDSSC